MFPFSWPFRDWCRAVLVFTVGVLLGAAIWWTSPALTGEAEPWDAEGRYYVWALFLAGAVATLFQPKAFWLAPIGVFTGQLLYGLYLYEPADAPLRPLGLVFAAFYCVAALAGAPGWADHFGMNSQPSQTKDWPARGEVAKLLEAQLHRIVELLRDVTPERLFQPAPGLGGRRSQAGWIIHGLHDEAKHSGGMYVLWKMCRLST